VPIVVVQGVNVVLDSVERRHPLEELHVVTEPRTEETAAVVVVVVTVVVVVVVVVVAVAVAVGKVHLRDFQTDCSTWLLVCMS